MQVSQQTHEEPKYSRTSNVVNLNVPPAKSKGWFDSTLLNGDVAKQIADINAQISGIRYKGGVEEPVKPKFVGKNASDEERAVYTVLQQEFLNNSKVYKAQKSAEYISTDREFKCYKELSKLSKLLKTKNKTERIQKGISECVEVLSGIAPSRKDNETDIMYERRSDRIIALRLSELVADTDLSNPDSIEDKLSAMLVANTDISLFIRKAELINEKVKFNNLSMITTSTVAEAVVTELLENAIRVATSFEVNKKSLQPDYVIMGDVKECSLYPLISQLDHFKAVEQRAARRVQYECDRKMHKADEYIKRYKECLSSNPKRTFKAPETKYPSFGQVEMQNGYAVGVPVQVATKNGFVNKTKYSWYGIELEQDVYTKTGRSFNGDIMKIVTDIKKRGLSGVEPELLKSVQVSANMKDLMSNIIIDLYVMFAMDIRILLKYNGTKIVNHKTALAAVKLMLDKSYKSHGGDVEWSQAHLDLFELIEEKIHLLTEHTRTLKNNKQ